MQHILTDRGIDFDAYEAYLCTIRDRLPRHVAAFAGDARRYSLSDRTSLHDAWLESVLITEPASGARHETRRTAVEVRLLGAFHDRLHVLRYTGVRRHLVTGADVTGGHGDLYTHEVRLAPGGTAIEHELLFVGAPDRGESRILIECADFTYEEARVHEVAG